jgi:elongation factor P
MDNESYEQLAMPADMVGAALPFLQDGMTVSVETYEGRPLSVALPQKVKVKIVEADPVVKGQTATSSYKPAILENGVRVMVPPFIPAGETIIVDTGTLEYVERAKAS